MLLSLSVFQETIIDSGRELSDQEISDALKYAFQYADEIETIHNQMVEIKNNLREAFKSHGIDEHDILKNN